MVKKDEILIMLFRKNITKSRFSIFHTVGAITVLSGKGINPKDYPCWADGERTCTDRRNRHDLLSLSLVPMFRIPAGKHCDSIGLTLPFCCE